MSCFCISLVNREWGGKAAHKAGRQGPWFFDECLYLQALGVLFFIAGPSAMLESAWASHAHSCKAPQSLEIVTNPGPLSGGESGCYQHSRKVTPVRGGGKNEARKVSQSCSGFCLNRYRFIVSAAAQCKGSWEANTRTHRDIFCVCLHVCQDVLGIKGLK